MSKMLHLTLFLYLLLKQNVGYNTFSLIFETFKFWITLEYFRRLGKRQIKHYDFYDVLVFSERWLKPETLDES